MNDYFTIDLIDTDAHIIIEYRHLEKMELLILTDSALQNL